MQPDAVRRRLDSLPDLAAAGKPVNGLFRLLASPVIWEMAYADGRVSEFEENVMWRVSDLLGVSARERIELRHQVADEQGGTSDKQ